MAELAKGQLPLVMPHYPHMLSEDTEVWTKFLASRFADIKEVWYDVHVGAGMPTVVPADTLGTRIARGISRKRIDVVCRVGGGYWVVEVKPYANAVALGQVQNYTRLFIAEFRPAGEVWPVVVCDAVDDDLRDDFELSGVVVIVND